jgi:hypothetical protein
MYPLKSIDPTLHTGGAGGVAGGVEGAVEGGAVEGSVVWANPRPAARQLNIANDRVRRANRLFKRGLQKKIQ